MSQLNINALANQSGSQTVPIDDVLNGTARAWVNFDGTAVVSIRAAYNVDSITDNGTGDYTLNFESPLPDNSYCIQAFGAYSTSYGLFHFNNLIRTVNQVQVACRQFSSSGYQDPEYAGVAIFR